MRMTDIITKPWAINPNELKEMVSVYSTHMKGPKIDLKDLKNRDELKQFEGYEEKDGIAVFNISGALAKRPGLIDRYYFGMCSMHNVKLSFVEAMEDETIQAIILNIDSPGGTVDGTQDLASTIASYRGVKPIIAFSDGIIMSAAYWIASAADKIYISSETSEIGSIGVVATHVDYSQFYKNDGVEITEIYSGKYKRIASQYKPLSQEGEEYIKSHTDYLYEIFVNEVAQNRGVTVDEALKMAEGKIYIGNQAIEAGLVDGVSTMTQLIDKINTKEDSNVLLTIETLASDHPEIYNAVLEKGKKESSTANSTAIDEAYKKGVEAGREQELTRIKAVKDQLIPGYESQVEDMMFDGKTTGEQAAVAIVQAEKENQANVLNNIHNNGPEPVDFTDDTTSSGSETNELSVEEKAKTVWDKDAKLRSEFGDNFEAYVAYERAVFDKNVKVQGGVK